MRGVRSRPPRDRRAVVPLRRLRRRAAGRARAVHARDGARPRRARGRGHRHRPRVRSRHRPDARAHRRVARRLRTGRAARRVLQRCLRAGGGRRARQPPRDDALDACGTPRGRVPDRRRATRRPLRRRRSSAHVRGNVRGDRPVAPHRAAGLRHRDRDLRRAPHDRSPASRRRPGAVPRPTRARPGRHRHARTDARLDRRQPRSSVDHRRDGDACAHEHAHLHAPVPRAPPARRRRAGCRSNASSTRDACSRAPTCRSTASRR